MASDVKVSVIVPVSERFDDVEAIYNDYKSALDTQGYHIEFIWVLDGEFSDVLAQLTLLQNQGEPIKVIKLAKSFGEATALAAGFQHSSGDILLTLPAYYQIEPSEIPNVLGELRDYDMVVGRRCPRIDSVLNRLQARVFNGLVNFIVTSSFHDLGCSVRALRREVMNEVTVYGDQHRFLPLLAKQQGFRVREMDLKQSKEDSFRRVYRPGVYTRRVLDVLTVFFLVKFTKKPLRFFGLIGTATFATGGLALSYLVIARLFLSIPLAERPALLLSSLLVVLGLQIFALGLLGELVIFTHAKDIKEYTIEEIIN